MASADSYREYLAGTTLTVAAASTTLTIPPRAMLWIEIAIPSIAIADIPALQFNGDTGTNYVSRYLSFAAGTTTITQVQTTATTMGRLGANTSTIGQTYLVALSNPALVTKVGSSVVYAGTGSAASVAALVFGGFEWVNSTDLISSIKLLTVSGNNFAIGTSIRITGGDFL